MMMDFNQENENDDEDSDRTETYTPPPLDKTDEMNSSSEKENHEKNSSFVRKEQSIIVLDESFDQVKLTEPMDRQSPVDHYWDQWPLVNTEINNEERSRLESIPDIDMPPSPPSRTSLTASSTQPSNSTENLLLDILTRPSSLPRSGRKNRSSTRKPVTKRKKKKKPMSQYRPPSPFSPKPDYKSMDIDQIRQHAMRYGLSNTLGKTRLVKILDEIYHVTHQYETDTDYEFESSDGDVSRENAEKKDLSHTPPTPAILPETKKVKKRPALHPMSSSDDSEVHLPPPTTTTDDANTQENQSDSSDNEGSRHEGRFLELTVHELSSTTTTSSSSPSILGTPPAVHSNPSLSADSKESPLVNSSQSSTTKKSKQPATSDSESTSTKPKKAPKRPKLETPTVPLKDLVRSYIESNPRLHARILCYEPIDFEEFHKQMKADLNLKIASKELMQSLDDQCITFTLRSRKGAFTSVMRAKRRHK